MPETSNRDSSAGRRPLQPERLYSLGLPSWASSTPGLPARPRTQRRYSSAVINLIRKTGQRPGR